MKFEVGQKMWFVPGQRRYGDPREVTISSVGRKWLMLEGATTNARADASNLYLDGGNYSSPGRCYLSKGIWEREIELANNWYNFKTLVAHRHGAPDGVTIADIQNCIDILGLDCGEEI